MRLPIGKILGLPIARNYCLTEIKEICWMRNWFIILDKNSFLLEKNVYFMTHHSKTNCSKLNIHFLWCYLFKIASWWWHLVCLLCLIGSSGTINGEDATLAKEKWQTCRNLIWIKRWLKVLRKGWLYKLLVNISLELLIYCKIHSGCMIIWVFFLLLTTSTHLYDLQKKSYSSATKSCEPSNFLHFFLKAF